ncbi:MAG TPA: hypothetical protein VFV81_06305, partial [Verrucomicrobiae bacterium]|nr:hypothetical protein [Verrucomicrobiae bacterium]
MKISFLSLAAAILLLSFPTVHGSVPGDEHWDSQFGLVGTSDRLQAISIFNNKIYVGSVFFAAGNTKANSVAGYDGTNWFRLNNGVSPPNNAFVYDLANDGTNLYLAGSFTNVDNSGARGMARWDGNNWWPLAGGNPNSLAACIKIVGTNFFVGGAFTTNGGVTVNGLARWDGSGWHALGSGVAGGTPGTYVLAMESDGTNLYVGGSFTQAGGITASNVARWNGSTWSAMGNGFATGFSGGIYALQKFGNDIYIGGSFTNSPLGIYNFARWDGAAWSPVGTGANGAVRCFLVVGSNLYVGGDFSQINGVAANRIAKWDGTTWSPLGSGIQGYGAGSGLGIYKMALDNQGRLIAAGNMSQAGGVGVSHIAGWDGTNWFALGGKTSKGLSHFIGVAQGLYCDGTNLFAGGFFTEGGATIVNGTARWDGTNWYSLGPVV